MNDDIIGFVRYLQEREGNEGCFKRRIDCKELKCGWHKYCLGGKDLLNDRFYVAIIYEGIQRERGDEGADL